MNASNSHRSHRLSLLNMIAVARQRRALSRLPDSALCDLGLSRTDAQKEAARPIWDVPQNWRTC